MSENRRIGKYEIQALLGKGASAAVFAGLDGDKKVALKIANRTTSTRRRPRSPACATPPSRPSSS